MRPDFQVINRATGPLVAIYEAKTGTIDYLSGPGSARFVVCNEFVDAYEAPKGLPSGSVNREAMDEVAETGTTRPVDAAVDSVLGKATFLMAIVGIAQGLHQAQQQSDALKYLEVYDPAYYRQLMCQSGAYV